MTKTVFSAEDFKPLNDGTWGTPIEVERRRRISLSVATYAYEIADNPIMDDAMWDWTAAQIDRRVPTGHPLLDEFFLTQFSAMTGMWIHQHPELEKIKAIYERYKARVLDVR